MKSLKTAALSRIKSTTATGILLTTIMLISAGCSSLPNGQNEYWEVAQSRQVEQVEHEKRYLAYKRQCYAVGRRIWIDGKHEIGRNGIPHRLDRYTCV